jgi:hypothetical protein
MAYKRNGRKDTDGVFFEGYKKLNSEKEDKRSVAR